MLSQSWFLITLIYPNGAPIDAVNRKLAVCANAGVRLNSFKAAHKTKTKWRKCDDGFDREISDANRIAKSACQRV